MKSSILERFGIVYVYCICNYLSSKTKLRIFIVIHVIGDSEICHVYVEVVDKTATNVSWKTCINR